MRTYLMRIPDILRGVSETLDVAATLCDRSWVVFNDDGVKILFIFERDGTLIVSKNGVVSRQSWSYIKATKAILIDNAEQSFLLHPAFIDNVIFALQQDGTEHHLFMIDEMQIDRIPQLTLNALNQYFTSKVRQIEEEEESRIRQIEKRREKERIRRIVEYELKPLATKYKVWHYMPLLIIIFLGGGSLGLASLLTSRGVFGEWIFVPAIIVVIMCIVIIKLIERRKVDKLKQELDTKRYMLWQKYLKEQE